MRNGITLGRVKKTVPQIILNIMIIALIIIMLYPLAFAAWNALKNSVEYENSKWAPSLPIRISNFSVAYGYIGQYMINTFKLAIVGVLGMLIISSLASYAIARIKFPGHKLCYAFVVMLMMMPGIITLVPQFLLYKRMGLYDHFFALVFPIWTNGSLMSVFLFVTFFRSIPNDLFEAADMDGAGAFRKYFTIALPLSMPIVLTATIIQVASIWNDYLWQQVVMSEAYTLPAGLIVVFDNLAFQSQQNIVFAGYLLASAPLILLFLFASKYYIQGLMGSAIKF